MFGYIRPYHNELKVKEYELYKSVYCGLCRVMGKRYSYFYKMSLSYDFVFMVLLRLYALPESVSFSKKRCIAHPTKKRAVMDENTALNIASDIGVIMLYHNFIDKINDKDGAKSFFLRFTLPEINRLCKKALKNECVAKFDKFMKSKLDTLTEIEKNNTPSVDMPAEEFGAILGEALSIGYTDSKKRIVYEIGRSVGKWIYIVDALDDIEKDCKKGSYNPLLASFGSVEEAKKHIQMIENSLLNELNNAEKSLLVLENTDSGVFNILINILRLGNPELHSKILKKYE